MGITESVISLLCPPEAVAVIVTEPIPTAVTTPSSTTAISGSEDTHETVLSVASSGIIWAVSLIISPALNDVVAGCSIVMSVVGVGTTWTIIL